MSAPRSDKWMPLYIGDYHKDTQRLTTLQHGAYLLLIMDYWVAGPPPDDDEQLASVTKLPVKEWRKVRQALVGKFQIRDGAWHHKRIDEELARASENTEKRSKAGARGAEKRWQTDSNAIASAKQTPSQNDGPSPSPSEESSKELSQRAMRAEFDDWYSGYPRKEDPKRALRAYSTARKTVSAAELTAGRDRYVLECRGKERQYIKQPATWLNAGSWQNETPAERTLAAAVESGLIPTPMDADERWRRKLAAWRSGGSWFRNLDGPAPGESGCRVPPHLLEAA